MTRRLLLARSKPETRNRKPAKARSGSTGPPAETGNRKPENRKPEAEMGKNVEKMVKNGEKWRKMAKKEET